MHEGLESVRLGLRGIPRCSEDVMVARDILLAEVTGARYHVAHISSRHSVDMVAFAKARGLSVTRLARGVPVGGELEYVDAGTIARAMLDRRSM